MEDFVLQYVVAGDESMTRQKVTSRNFQEESGRDAVHTGTALLNHSSSVEDG
jgi:hypothetical protein